MQNLKLLILFCTISICYNHATAQNFLSTQGRAIVNENQDTILLRGMGLGGWMVQEGYMLQTAGFANPQHQIRAIIEDLIGATDTEIFYEAWLENHVTRTDIDSLKAWGFNSVRLPMHYNLFTLPIEDEPLVGQDTWLDKGFELTDRLIEWCKDNEMYVILDMHASPGGQGYDEAISDYDPNKPSIWESAENRRKLAALWKRIAERYAHEEWVGGYDLLNEPNWDLPGGTLLRTLYEDITQGIREVDDKHIIFIEGNWFANDFTGLTPPWDDNFVYSPHKYWSTNDEATMQWVIDLRNTYNVPLYLGESGENSNVWFRDAIRLLEDLDIGWAWWPMKKIDNIAGPLSIEKTEEYQTLLDYWSGNAPKPSAEFGRAALMDLTEKLLINNCKYQKDVTDAMFRQVYSDETIPFKSHTIPGVIHAVDYDLGVVGHAYYDTDVANYQVSSGNFTSWNAGWQYRNDGVDIEISENTINTNGYNVGFTEPGEWMQYKVNVQEAGVYEAHVRTSSGSNGGSFHFSIDGADITPPTTAGPTGGWQEWQTVIVPNIIIQEENNKLRFHTDQSGYNVSSFEFVKTDINIEELPNLFVSAETVDEMTIRVTTNKSLNSSLPAAPGGFQILINGSTIPITGISAPLEDNRMIDISLGITMNSTQTIRVSYDGNEVLAEDGTTLSEFILKNVKNNIRSVNTIPGRVQAEDFIAQVGTQLETTTDTGGGQNIGYLDIGDYLDYDVNILNTGNYEIDYRTAAEYGTGGLELQLIDGNDNITIVDSQNFNNTGGWQTWETTKSVVFLPQGRHIMRIVITQAPFNLNWLEFEFLSTSTNEENLLLDVSVFPNPSSSEITVQATLPSSQNVKLNVINYNGKLILSQELSKSDKVNKLISIRNLQPGNYILQLEMEGKVISNKAFTKI